MKEIETFEFEHEGKLYRYRYDKIERKYEHLFGWSTFIALPLSSTKYAKSKEDIKTICMLALAIHEQGVERGKKEKQREICHVIGADSVYDC